LDLDITITPQTISTAIARSEYTLAINMALHLSERSSLKSAVDSVPVDAIELVVKAIDGLLLKDLLKYIADEIVSD
jgi:hypothetical protein